MSTSSPEHCNDLVVALCAALGQRRLYGPDHPRVHQACSGALGQLRRLLASSQKSFVFLGVVEDQLVHEGRFLVGPTILGRKLIDLANNLSCGGFHLGEKTTEADVVGFIELAATLTEKVDDIADARSGLADLGVNDIQLSPAYEDPGWFGQFLYEGTERVTGSADLKNPPGENLVPVCQSLYGTVEHVHGQASRSGGVDLAGAGSVVESLIEAAGGNYVDIMQLVRYPDYDSYTVGHSVRVALILIMVSHALGVSGSDLLTIGTAGLLHDVGKGRIPRDVLYKQGRLDAAERKIMELHTVFGAETLLDSRSHDEVAVAAAWGHHLRHDGGGYPAAPGWARRHWVTRLLHVCDVYEALTAIRPYKPEMSARRALEVMVDDTGCFDPWALRAFIAVMGAYPPGTMVRMTDGRTGVVLSVGAEIDRPLVRLTHDAMGLPIDGEDGVTIDLGAHSSRGLAIA